jgi:hypothetical protein
MSSYVASPQLLSYAFNPVAGSINFAATAGFKPYFLKAITDQTQNVFLYLPGVAGFGGTWDATGTVLTLQSAAVSSCAATDQLLIQYDDQQNALSAIAELLSGSTSGALGDHSTLLFHILLKLDAIADMMSQAWNVIPNNQPINT